jgi:hypothetical protein
MVTFPEISEKDLQVFRDTYGLSAFVCRYLHCAFSSDGFDSFAKRAKHESQHQRKFRCGHSSCVYFTSGFATRNLLNKHNEKYHPAITEGPSLVESLAPLLTEPMTQPRSDGQGGPNGPGISPNRQAFQARQRPTQQQRHNTPPNIGQYAPPHTALQNSRHNSFDRRSYNGAASAPPTQPAKYTQNPQHPVQYQQQQQQQQAPSERFDPYDRDWIKRRMQEDRRIHEERRIQEERHMQDEYYQRREENPRH